jgi:hypothetical protein
LIDRRHDGAERCARGKPVEKRRERRGTHGELVASVANVMKHERYPAAAGLLGLRHIELQLVECRRGFHGVIRAHLKWIGRRHRVRVRAADAAARHDETTDEPRRVVAALRDDLPNGGVLARERIRERRDAETALQERRAIVADLPADLVRRARREPRVTDRVPGDLVTRLLHREELLK